MGQRREARLELSDIQQQSRRQLGIEIEPRMSAYIQRMMQPTDSSQTPIPVIGADARTGVAVRRWVPMDTFISVQP
jgi:hypothetical protein